jgi:hypothetical protein
MRRTFTVSVGVRGSHLVLGISVVAHESIGQLPPGLVEIGSMSPCLLGPWW